MEANKKGENYHNKKEGITKERDIKERLKIGTGFYLENFEYQIKFVFDRKG